VGVGILGSGVGGTCNSREAIKKNTGEESVRVATRTIWSREKRAWVRPVPGCLQAIWCARVPLSKRTYQPRTLASAPHKKWSASDLDAGCAMGRGPRRYDTLLGNTQIR